MSKEQSTHAADKSETQTETTNNDGSPPANVSVTVSAPAQTEETDDEEGEDHTAAIAEIGERIAAVDARITEGLTGERTWTETTISSLRQELADLRADLTQAIAALPNQITALREELTRLLQERQQVSETLEAVITTEAPPQSPPNADADGTPVTATVPDASPNAAGKPKSSQPKRRVV